MTILYRPILLTCLAIAFTFCFNPSAIALSSNNLDTFNTGLEYLRQHDYLQALQEFTNIEEGDNLTGAAYSNRCLINLQLQNNAEAEADCAIAIKYNPYNLEAYLNLGLAEYRQGKYQNAIANYQKIIDRNQQDYRAYYNRGLGYFALKQYQNAIADYKTALKYTPTANTEPQSIIHNDLALAYMVLNKNQLAIDNFSQAISLDSNNYGAYYNRGCAYHQQGKYQIAIQDLSHAVLLKPDFTQAYVHRGIINHQIGATKNAFNDLTLALKQYQDRNNQEQFNAVLNLKQQLFYNQPSKVV